MIEIQIASIPARGGIDPWDVATATVDGDTFTERSRSSAIAKLARSLVKAGVPDQQWIAIRANGTVSLRGRALHAIAKTTITESDKGGLRRAIWRPRPSRLAANGEQEAKGYQGAEKATDAVS